jgi:hypothetical protein
MPVIVRVRSIAEPHFETEVSEEYLTRFPGEYEEIHDPEPSEAEVGEQPGEAIAPAVTGSADREPDHEAPHADTAEEPATAASVDDSPVVPEATSPDPGFPTV